MKLNSRFLNEMNHEFMGALHENHLGALPAISISRPRLFNPF